MINDNYVPLNQLGNGVTTVFSGSWNMLNASYIRVYFEDTTTGVQTLQSTGWSLTFSDSGFSVTFSVAPPSTVRVIIGRVVALAQSTPFRTSRGWQGNTVENAFDKVVGMAQDIGEQVDRALVFPLGDTTSPILPSATLRANKTFIFDSMGNASAGSVTGTTVSSAMIPVVNAATTAAAAGLLGALTTAAGAVANTNLATMTANTVKANATAGVASPTDIALAASQLLGRPAAGNIGAITLGAGLSLVGSALTATAGGTTVGVQVFTGSGTYTPTSGMDYCIVEVVGGGGGGGGGNTNAVVASAGAGGYARKLISAATVGVSQVITIGAGGTAGSNSPTNGGDGGTSSFGAIISCTGGQGTNTGTHQATMSGSSNSVTPSGGTATGGDININGGSGQTCINVTSGGGIGISGGGVSTPLGFGGAGARNGTGFANATSGSGYGSSAGGSRSGIAGVAGQPGIIIVTEFI